ncbi:hypothetical protein CWATWH0402_1902 [Crocosphaera watsonii WH 0402]|uniref:Uncharacterized protein n=1 Tax=Crocosphaera watsonii WH 0402 TaxID=1284629 RepID=T2JZ05_CROWT|nr:hypothetical protein CWATWH0402_1902 [Crocosphaera watsonii WH 0402]
MSSFCQSQQRVLDLSVNKSVITIQVLGVTCTETLGVVSE